MAISEELAGNTGALLERFRAYCFPRGEDSARSVRAITATEQGEIRSSPASPWIPFTAKEVIESGRSSFRWEARYRGGSKGLITVTDAYEEGHGRLVVKLGGIIPVQRVTGPEADKGELQRYLASILLCPPILLNHASLEWTTAAPLLLRVRDRSDRTGASVDLEMSEEGQPLACQAERPRVVGKESILTPWSATCSEFREWEGFRAARRIEVSWGLPAGAFIYYRSEVVSMKVAR